MTREPDPEKQEPELTKAQITKQKLIKLGKFIKSDPNWTACRCKNPNELPVELPSREELRNLF